MTASTASDPQAALGSETTYRMYIDGQWVPAEGGQTFEERDPFSGEVVGRAAAGTRADARRAIEAAHAALHGWWKTPPGEKQRMFLKAAEILERRGQAIVQLLAKETGCTFGFGMFQAGFTAGLLRAAAGEVYNSTGEILPSDLPGAFFMAVRQPAGVVAGISPWNAPLILSFRAIALPLAYGNTVVLKPSEESPITGGVFCAEVLEEAGFPKGVFNMVTHDRGGVEAIGDEFIENPKVRRVSFTGSTRVGRKLAEKAGRHLKRIVLELGGQNPLIILRDADLNYAVDAAAFGTFLHQGQICMSSRKIIVERPVADEFIDKLVAKTKKLKVGSPSEPDTVVGPLINQESLERVKASVDEAVAKGARLLTGGKAQGPCFEPTLLADVTSKMQISSEETFGPVAFITVVESPEEAVREANDTLYGLSAGIITRNFDQALTLADQLESGMVHINDQPVADEPQVPFGGTKESGWGRLGGKAAREEFTELRWITVQREPRHFPF